MVRGTAGAASVNYNAGAAHSSIIMGSTSLTTEDFEVIKLLGRGTFGIVR